MKKLLMVLIVCLVLGVNNSIAQDLEEFLNPPRFTFSTGINPVALFFGIFDFEIESYIYNFGEGVYPIIGYQLFRYSDTHWDITAYGITFGFKRYFKKSPEGGYIKSFLSYASASATYSDYYFSSYASTTILGTGLNFGYRWNFGNEKRFYIAPEIGGLFFALSGGFFVGCRF